LRDPAKSWAQTDPCGPCGPKGLEEVITGEELRLKEPNGSRRVPRDEPCDMGPWPRARLITPGGGRTPASSTPQERSFGVPNFKEPLLSNVVFLHQTPQIGPFSRALRDWVWPIPGRGAVPVEFML